MPTVPVLAATARPPASAELDELEATFSIDSVVSLATFGSSTRLPVGLCW